MIFKSSTHSLYAVRGCRFSYWYYCISWEKCRLSHCKVFPKDFNSLYFLSWPQEAIGRIAREDTLLANTTYFREITLIFKFTVISLGSSNKPLMYLNHYTVKIPESIGWILLLVRGAHGNYHSSLPAVMALYLICLPVSDVGKLPTSQIDHNINKFFFADAVLTVM